MVKLNSRQHITKTGIVKNNPIKDAGWTVLINTNEGHNKFWSFRNTMNGAVEVRWGKIGTQGQMGLFEREDVLRKKNKKLNEGYREYGYGLGSPFPR